MESKIEEAVNKKKNGYNCAQAVACTYCDYAGIDEETMFNICQAFGTGMGTLEGTCGAIVGAGVVLGMMNKQRLKTNQDIRKIMQDFKAQNSTVICKELKGIGTELMNIAKNYCKEKNGDNYKITVNSAPFAIDFYHKIGFKDTGKEQTVDGIRFLPMQISIYKFKEYGAEYFDYLYQTKKECFKWYVEKIYGPWEDEFQVEFFKNFIREKRNYIKIIIYNDRPIGMFTNYINEDGNDFIDLFYIDKVYQGNGIGTQILKEQLLVDKKSNVDTVLQVFKENPAKKLYEKVGFEVYDETDTHYKMIKKIKEE